MSTDIAGLMRDVVASPLGDVIASVGEGVAAAQQALDEASLARTLEIYREGGSDAVALLRQVGYQPTFYALPDTSCEVVVSLQIAGGDSQGGSTGTAPASGRPATPAAPAPAAPARAGLAPSARFTSDVMARKLQPGRTYVTPVDATFATRYNYQAAASARLTFKIVPVPPPDGLDRARVMPDLANRDAATALTVLDMLGLTAVIRDADGNVVQEVPAGATVKATTPVASTVITTDVEVTVQLAG